LSHHNTALHQLLKPISRHEFESQANQHHCGQKLRCATRWDQFTGMVMSQLAGRQSLRDIESTLHSQQAKLYHLGAKPIARTTLARLNKTQPFELYQTLFCKLLKRFHSTPSNHKFRFKNPLYSLDASQIDLSVKIFPWAHCNKNKAAVKLNVGLNHSNLVPEFVAISNGKESELIEGRQFNFPKGSIVVFDKGYIDYSWFKLLRNKGVFFVTRLRSNAAYSVLERKRVNKNQGLTSDQLIQLNHPQAIKQNLKIKTFVGTSRNAILTQIWIAMIVYLLLAYARHSAKTGWTVQRIMRVIQVNLFETKTLKEILDPDPPRHKKYEPQMHFAL